MIAQIHTDSLVIERLQKAMNNHDLEAFVECFNPDYQSEQPVHPDRRFRGREQVRKNWSAFFGSIRDFQTRLLRSAGGDDAMWTEWHWYGTQPDGTRFDMRGVIIFGIQNDRIIWGRLYMEPLQESGAGIDAAVDELAKSGRGN